jgi:hypothetical protein
MRAERIVEPLGALRRLVAGSHRARPEDLPALAVRAGQLLGADEVVLYLVDYGQVNLVPLPGPGAPRRGIIGIEGTLAGRAFARTEVLEADGDSAYRLWLPLLDGTERLGVVEVVTAEPPPESLREAYLLGASLLAELVVTRRTYGDVMERVRRRLPMQLAAEILWNLLPPLTFEAPGVAVSAILEPAYDVGGDAFDYAVNGDILHAGIFDAAGHGIGASALTSLTISAYRNARRCGLDLVDTYRSIDKWVSAQHPGTFVTALLAELDARRGVYTRISAGHPGELLLRDGRLVRALPAPTVTPLGLGDLTRRPLRVMEEVLQPGDQLLLYTDGVVEARTEDGKFFGLDRLIDFVTRTLADRVTAPETMRRLVHAILAHQHENLQDDATAVLLEWRPGGATTHPPVA